MDADAAATRAAWARASRKYEDEYAEHLDLARTVQLLPPRSRRSALSSPVPTWCTR